MEVKVICCLLITTLLVNGMPTDKEDHSTTIGRHPKKDNHLTSGRTHTEKHPPEVTNWNELVEIKEADIPEGAWVMAVDEPAHQRKQAGEAMETANNVVFRPLFRYRQRESTRRSDRRYYVPRERSYRGYRAIRPRPHRQNTQ